LKVTGRAKTRQETNSSNKSNQEIIGSCLLLLKAIIGYQLMVTFHPESVKSRYICIGFVIVCVTFLYFFQTASITDHDILAFGLTSDHGQVRCTSGNLVSSPTQCPSSDLCPSSERLGTVVHCSFREPHKSTSLADEKKKERKALDISIFTNQKTYASGKVITFTVKNQGSEPLTFSDSTSDIKIRNMKTGQNFPFSPVPEKFTLDSGASKKFKWNQEDANGNQVKSGKYRIIISIGPIDDRDTFTILR